MTPRRRHARSQILPFFGIIVAFMAIPLLALMLDGVSYMAATREADSLAWRSARHGAAQVAMNCGVGAGAGKTGVVDPGAPGDDCALSGGAGVAGSIRTYVDSWLSGSARDMSGLRFSDATVTTTMQGDRVRVHLHVCYRPYFVGFLVNGTCGGGDVGIDAYAEAAPLLSN